jgi:peptide/nickel transport system substrate-binding protein
LDLVASAGYGAYIFSPECAKGKKSAFFNAGNDCGSGPYTLKSSEPGQRVVLEAFEDYWGGWNEDQFEDVILQVVEDPTLRQQMIESGDADFTYEIPIDNLQSLDENPDVEVVANPAFQNLIAFFNTQKAPLDDPQVRKALALTFPYKAYIDNVMQGFAEQSNGVIPHGLFGHSESVPQYEQDLDQARELLQRAGIDETPLTLTHVTGDQNEAQAAELWKAELAKVGVDLKIRAMSWEAQWDLGKSEPVTAQDIFVMYWWPTYPTPYDHLYSMFHSEEEPFFNLGYYSNGTFDKTIDRANTLLGTDKAEAEQMFVEAQKMLYRDTPAIPIFDQENIHVVRSDIKGYDDNPAYPHVVFFYELSR